MSLVGLRFTGALRALGRDSGGNAPDLACWAVRQNGWSMLFHGLETPGSEACKERRKEKCGVFTVLVRLDLRDRKRRYGSGSYQDGPCQSLHQCVIYEERGMSDSWRGHLTGRCHKWHGAIRDNKKRKRVGCTQAIGQNIKGQPRPVHSNGENEAATAMVTRGCWE